MLLRNSENKGVSNIVSVLLITLLVISIAGGFYYWISRIQGTQQESTSINEDELLKQAITDLEIIEEPVYNSLAEKNVLEDAWISAVIKNSGTRTIDFSDANKLELIIYSGDKVICVSNVTGECIDSANRVIVGGNKGSVFYSENGGFFNTKTNLTAEIVSAFDSYENVSFAGTGYNGKIYASANGIDWEYRFSAGPGYISDFEIDGDTIYALHVDDENSTLYYSTDNGYNWTQYRKWINYSLLQLLSYSGTIYSAGRNLTNGTIIDKNSDETSWVFNKTVNCIAEFNGDLYAGVNDGALYAYDSSWSQIGTFEESIKSIAEFENKLYLGTSNISAWGAVYSSADGLNFYKEFSSTGRYGINKLVSYNNKLYAVSLNKTGYAAIYQKDASTEFSTYGSVNASELFDLYFVSGCDTSLVECISGCDEGELKPNAIRKFEFKIENTICDLMQNDSTNLKIKFNVKKESQVVKKFKKGFLDEELPNTPCKLTWPLCNGNTFNESTECVRRGDACIERDKIPACGDDAYPECSISNEKCPEGKFCKVSGTTCECQDSPELCSDFSPPSCSSGTCYLGKKCVERGDSCVCLGCSESFPECDGGCFYGTECQSYSLFCECNYENKPPPNSEICDNSIDDDGDTDVDCDDSDCSTHFHCIIETPCNDNIDNDGGGGTDCSDEDEDCEGELCNEQCYDDSILMQYYCNGDDCENSANTTCPANTACFWYYNQCIEEDCGNSVDDDNDGKTDCADDPFCTDEICGTGCDPTSPQLIVYFRCQGTPGSQSCSASFSEVIQDCGSNCCAYDDSLGYYCDSTKFLGTDC